MEKGRFRKLLTPREKSLLEFRERVNGTYSKGYTSE